MIEIQTDSVAKKVLLAAVIAGACLFAWFSVRWQLGDMIGEFTSASDAEAFDLAGSAIAMSPGDPRGYWLAGAAIRNDFDLQDPEAAIKYFENATRRGPYHYLWWTELGRAREQSGDAEKAEQAFLNAVELAPEYAIPRWQLGNFYLRQGRSRDAIRELKIAAKYNNIYRTQVFQIAWNVLGNDPFQVEQFASDSPEVRSALAMFYSGQNRPDDAIRVWNMLSDADKAAFKETASAIAKSLFDRNSFRGALEFSRQSGVDSYARPEAITNGGFELSVGERRRESFDWLISRTDGRSDIGTDPTVKHSGSRSLKITFRGYDKPDFRQAVQLVAVVPGRKYKLELWARTEGLKSGGMPLIEVLDPADSKRIAASEGFEAGTHDWRQYSIEFAAPERTDGVVIITGREPCVGACPIVGILWLDDFQLSQIQ